MTEAEAKRGRRARDKGKEGELEVVHLAEQYGFEAERTGNRQANRKSHSPDVKIQGRRDIYIEVKRDEKLGVDAMVRQARDGARGRTPIVIWRRNRGEWTAAVPMDVLFGWIKYTGTKDA